VIQGSLAELLGTGGRVSGVLVVETSTRANRAASALAGLVADSDGRLERPSSVSTAALAGT
jgi:hypothetical protein